MINKTNCDWLLHISVRLPLVCHWLVKAAKGGVAMRDNLCANVQYLYPKRNVLLHY